MNTKEDLFREAIQSLTTKIRDKFAKKYKDHYPLSKINRLTCEAVQDELNRIDTDGNWTVILEPILEVV